MKRFTAAAVLIVGVLTLGLMLTSSAGADQNKGSNAVSFLHTGFYDDATGALIYHRAPKTNTTFEQDADSYNIILKSSAFKGMIELPKATRSASGGGFIGTGASGSGSLQNRGGLYGFGDPTTAPAFGEPGRYTFSFTISTWDSGLFGTTCAWRTSGFWTTMLRIQGVSSAGMTGQLVTFPHYYDPDHVLTTCPFPHEA